MVFLVKKILLLDYLKKKKKKKSINLQDIKFGKTTFSAHQFTVEPSFLSASFKKWPIKASYSEICQEEGEAGGARGVCACVIWELLR